MLHSITGFTIKQLLHIFIILALLFIVKKYILLYFKNYIINIFAKINFLTGEKEVIENLIFNKIIKPLILFIYIIAFTLIVRIALVNIEIIDFFMRVVKTVFAINIAYCCSSIVDIFEYKLKSKIESEEKESKINLHLIPIFKNTLKVFFYLIISVWIIETWGYNVNSIIASLGIGGLAVALAAKDTLANIFASITILIDKPFKPGDRVKGSNFDGTIEYIGLRCSKIKNLDGSYVTIANNQLVQNVVSNITRRPSIRQLTTIGVTYSTPREKVIRAVEIIKNAIMSIDQVDKENIRVHFNEFGPYSLNILVLWFFIPPVWWDFVAANEKINFQIMEEFEKEGIEIAFPTQTLHIKKEDENKFDK